MDSVLLDTDVLSYLFKQDSRGENYKPHLDGKLGVISFMTVAELDFWANIRNWGAQRRAALSAFLEPYTIINSDIELAHTWAAIRSEVMRNGHHIDTADCWICRYSPAPWDSAFDPQQPAFRARERSYHDLRDLKKRFALKKFQATIKRKRLKNLP